ncbi:hypothetical protein CLOM_g22653 [Closterium sp. NIES-68]|nr:hypothetical protein CLOM_g22653 [Closterium sp. NIES-68]
MRGRDGDKNRKRGNEGSRDDKTLCEKDAKGREQDDVLARERGLQSGRGETMERRESHMQREERSWRHEKKGSDNRDGGLSGREKGASGSRVAAPGAVEQDSVRRRGEGERSNSCGSGAERKLTFRRQEGDLLN